MAKHGTDQRQRCAGACRDDWQRCVADRAAEHREYRQPRGLRPTARGYLRGALPRLAGNTHTASGDWRRISSSSRTATSDNATRCKLFCLVVEAGLTHTPAARSKSAHFAASSSPRRAPVSSASRTALATVTSGNSAKRGCQPAKLGLGEIAVAFLFGVAFDAKDRIFVAVAPAHRQAEHFREQRQDAVGVDRRTRRNRPVQGVDVGERYRRHLRAPEHRQDVDAQLLAIIALGCRPLARDMLGEEPVGQVGDGGSRTLLAQLANRVGTRVDLTAQPPRLLAGGRGRPIGKAPMV